MYRDLQLLNIKQIITFKASPYVPYQDFYLEPNTILPYVKIYVPLTLQNEKATMTIHRKSQLKEYVF